MPNSLRDRSEQLRVALVGAGKMARHHALAIGRSRVPAELVAVADPSPEARDAVRQIVPHLLEADSLREVLATVEVDVVHVCTPPATHADLATLALNAGCHVYVEKPFAPTEQAASRILETADELGLRVCPGHQLLFERPAREALELMPALGTIQHVESYFAFRPVRGSGGQAAIRPEEQLLDILPHPVYVLLAAFEAAGLTGPTELVSLTVGEGTIHAVLRRGRVTGSLVVTLTGRPVDSYLRLVGTNGSIHGDFVRGVVVRQLGPGSSGIDKLLAPYRTARQLAWGTTGAMARRFASRKRSYPGLQEIFEAFYDHVVNDETEPVSRESIIETVRIQERVSRELSREASSPAGTSLRPGSSGVLVTGGTGYLGRAIVQELCAKGKNVRVLARRPPASWDRVPDIEYVSGDLADGCDPSWLRDITTVIHCAAATAGGWEAHQAASIDATEHLLKAIETGGCQQLIHVSSIAVVDDSRSMITESSPYLKNPRGSGPYAWGKLESERLVRNAKRDGCRFTIVRPGAIVDYDDFDPPGRLGKRLGNLFVAVGARGEELGVIARRFCAEMIVSLVEDPRAPAVLHLLDVQLPTRRNLVERLRQRNPDLKVVWLPRWAVRPLGWVAVALQKVLRPNVPPVDVAAVFGNRRYDGSLVAKLSTSDVSMIEGDQGANSESDAIKAR